MPIRSFVATFAGAAGTSGSTNATGASARFNTPAGMTCDLSGNVFVVDSANHLIRKITSAGVVTTFAGSGSSGSTNGTGTAASFNNPFGIAIDSAKNLYIADTSNNMIRKITPQGVVTTLAGSTTSGSSDGVGTSASFNGPRGITVDSNDIVYVADTLNNKIRKITADGTVTTFAGPAAGTTTSGSTDGTTNSARFNSPYSIAADGANNLYVADYANHKIRLITSAGVVTTFAGSGSSGDTNNAPSGYDKTLNALTSVTFNNPWSIAVDKKESILYISEYGNNKIKSLTIAGKLLIFAGSGEGTSTSGSTDGVDLYSKFNAPHGIAVSDNGIVYVSDSQNHTIRKIANTVGQVDVFAGPAAGTSTSGSTNGVVSVATFNGLANAAFDQNGNMYVVDKTNRCVRKITVNGVVSTVISSSYLTSPRGIAVDLYNSVYVSDDTQNNIIKMDQWGSISTFVSGLSQPIGLCIDNTNRLYVACFGNNKIMTFDPYASSSILAGSGAASSVDGTGASATFNGPYGIAVDAQKNAYVTELNGNKIRKISGIGVVTTLAGSGSSGDSDGTGAAASFNMPISIAVDSSYTLYVADNGNNKIRKITSSGVVTTLAGPAAGTTTSGDVSGIGSEVRFSALSGVAVDERNNLYAMDGNKIKCVATATTNTVRPYSPSYSSTVFVSKSSSESIYHPVVDSNGNVWGANWASPYSIIKYDSTGSLLLEISTNKIYNLALDSSNNVYTFDGVTIAKYNGSTGTQVWTVTTPTAANYGYIFTSPNYLYLFCNCSSGSRTAGTSSAGLTVTFNSTVNGYNVIKYDFDGYAVSVITSPTSLTDLSWATQKSVDCDYNDNTNYWGPSLKNSYNMAYVDSSDNVYVRFKTSSSQIDFGNSVVNYADSLDLSLLRNSNNGSPTTYRDLLVKYNSSGVAQWQKDFRFRPENSSWLGLTTIGFDADLNIYVGGFTYTNYPRNVTSGTRPTMDTYDFRINMTDDYRYYVGFIVKYDTNGVHKWNQIERMYGSGGSEPSSMPLSFDVDDANGVLYVAGSTALKGNHSVRLGLNDKLTMSYSSEADTNNTGPNWSGSKGYVAQYDLNGNCYWINTFRDNNKVGWGYDRTGNHAVYYRNSKLYATGQFKLGSATGTGGVTMTDMKIIDTNNTAVQALTPANTNKSLYYTIYNLLPPVVPDAPTGVTAVAKNTSAIVSWTAPEFNGRSRITGYIVTPSSGSSVTVDSNTFSTTVSGLTNGVAYTFTVKAINAVGNSAASSASNSVTPANQPPEAPTNVFATVTGAAAQAVVTWSAPIENGGRPVTSYTINPIPSGTPVTITATDASGSVVTTGTVTGLTNGAAYTFTVTATNSVGTSSASSGSNSVTPYTVPNAPTSVSEVFDPSALSGASLWLDASDSSTLTLVNTNQLTAWANKISGGANATVRLGSSYSNTWVSPTVVSNGLNGKSYLDMSNNESIEIANNYNNASLTFLIVAKILSGNDLSKNDALISTLESNGLGRGIGILSNYYRVYSSNTTSTFGASYSINNWVILSVRYNTTGVASFRVNGSSYSVNVSASAPSNTSGLKIGIGTPETVTSTPSTKCQIAEVFAYTSYLSDVDIVRLETYVAEKWNLWGNYANYVPSLRGGNGVANLYWNVPTFNGGSAITNYTVNSTPAINTITQSGTNVVVGGLTNGTSYLFDIKANNARGASSSLNYTIIPGATAPSAPIGLSATVTAAANRATVTWLAPVSDGGSSIISYTVTSEPGGFTSTTADGITLTADVTGLTNGTSYIFRVNATNAVGTSSASFASVAVVPYTVPNAPTAVSAVPSNASCALTWSAPSDNGGSAITGYKITASPAITPISIGVMTSYNVTGLTNGIEYVFYIQAINARGLSTAANFNAATPSPILPTAPRAVTTNVASAGSGEVIVSWLAPLDDGGAPITQYTVTSSPDSITAQVDGDTLSTTVSGLTNGTSYTFTVIATNNIGNSPASSASAATIPYTVPGVPTVVSATSTNAAAILSWSAPASNGGNAITTYTLTSSPASTIITTASTTATVTGLINGTSYTFTVCANNARGASTSVNFTAVTPAPIAPTAPRNITTSIVGTTATVSWIAPVSNGGATITGYTVKSYPTVGSPVTVNGTTLTANVTGLIAGVEYTFSVYATNSVGNSSESYSAPAPITFSTATFTTPSTLTMTWNKPAGFAVQNYTISAGFTALYSLDTISSSPNIEFALDDSTLGSVGNTTSTWATSTGNTNNDFIVNGYSAPTIVAVDGKPNRKALRFSATNNTTALFQKTPWSPSITTYTITIVARCVTGTSKKIIQDYSSNTFFGWWYDNINLFYSNNWQMLPGYGNQQPFLTTNNGSTDWRIYTFRMDGTTFSITVGGVKYSFTTNGTSPITQLLLGGLGEATNCDIAALYVWKNRAISDTEMFSYEYQLSQKYGVPLSTWNGYANNTDYGFSVSSIVSYPSTIAKLNIGLSKNPYITGYATNSNVNSDSAIVKVNVPNITFVPYYDSTTPTSVSGLRVWLDASDTNTLTGSGSVSQWMDKSGNNFAFTQPTSANQPTISANGLSRQSLSFTGTNGYQYITNTNATVTNSAYTIFAVGKQNTSTTTWTGYNYLIKGNPSTDSLLFFGARGGTFTTFTGGTNSWNDTNANSPSQSVQSTSIMSIVVNGSTLTPYFNGTAQNTKTGTTASFAGFRIGDTDNGNLGQNWSGFVGEILIYNGALSTSDRQTIEGYLAWKWNIVSNLPAGHPYKSSPPMSAPTDADKITSTATILNLPTRPIPSTIVTSNARALLRWQPPLSDGGSAITSYTISSQPSVSTITTTSTIYNYIGLTNDTSYTFYVQANNAVGNSLQAAWDPVTPLPDPASAPSSISVVAGNTVANVSWLPPASNGGGIISSYMIVASPGGATTSVLGNLSSATLTGLANGSNYTLSLTAVNSVGNGVAATVPVTPVEFLSDANTIFYYTFQNPGDTTAATVFTDSSAANNTLPHTPTTGGSIETVGGRQAYRLTNASTAPSMLVKSVTNVTNITYAFWIYLDSSAPTNTGVIFSRGNLTTMPTGVRVNSRLFTYLDSSGRQTNSAVVIDYNVWSHVAVVITPTGSFWYKNGSLVQQVVSAYPTTAKLGEFSIGFDSTSFSTTKLPGSLQGVTVMTRALSAPEIALLYNYSAPEAPTNITVAATGYATTVGFTPAPSQFGFENTYSLTSIPAVSTFYTTLSSLRYYTLALGSNYTYVLRTFNKLGASSNALSQTYTTPLSNIVISPNEPTGVSAHATNANAVNLTWNAPDFDGGSGLSYYTALAVPGNISITVNGSTRTANFSSLLSTATYTFTVKAVNTAGESQNSVPATLNMTNVPGAPDMRFAYRASVSTANVYWSAPAGASVSSYTITASPGGATVNTPASNLYSIVSSLTSNMNYSFSVVANNAYGTGPSSAPSGIVGYSAAPTVVSTLNTNGTSIFVKWNSV